MRVNTRWSTVDKQRGLPAIICSEHAGLSAWIKADIHDRRQRVERVNSPADRKSIELEVPRHDVLCGAWVVCISDPPSTCGS